MVVGCFLVGYVDGFCCAEVGWLRHTGIWCCVVVVVLLICDFGGDLLACVFRFLLVFFCGFFALF